MERTVRMVLDFGRRSLARFVELEGFDRAMALAGQAFAALLPLLIVFGTVAQGSTDEVADDLIERFDVSGSAADTLRDAVGQPPESGVSVIGVLLLVISALSFTRALQRLYVRAWRLEKLGVRGNLWGLLWLAAFIVYWSLQPAIAGFADGVAGFGILGVAFALLSLLFAVALVLVVTAALGATLADRTPQASRAR